MNVSSHSGAEQSRDPGDVLAPPLPRMFTEHQPFCNKTATIRD